MTEAVFEYRLLLTGSRFFEQNDWDNENYLEVKEGDLLIRRPIKSKRRGGPSHQTPAWYTVEGEQAKVRRKKGGRGSFDFPQDASPTVIFVSQSQTKLVSLNRIEKPVQDNLL